MPFHRLRKARTRAGPSVTGCALVGGQRPRTLFLEPASAGLLNSSRSPAEAGSRVICGASHHQLKLVANKNNCLCLLRFMRDLASPRARVLAHATRPKTLLKSSRTPASHWPAVVSKEPQASACAMLTATCNGRYGGRRLRQLPCTPRARVLAHATRQKARRISARRGGLRPQFSALGTPTDTDPSSQAGSPNR